MSNIKRYRNHTLYLRLSKEEYESFEQSRVRCNMNKTKYFLQLLSHHHITVVPIKDELQSLIHEFKKQGVNLNQIAYSLNQNPYTSTPLPDLMDLQKQNRLLTEKLADLFEQVTIV